MGVSLVERRGVDWAITHLQASVEKEFENNKTHILILAICQQDFVHEGLHV